MPGQPSSPILNASDHLDNVSGVSAQGASGGLETLFETTRNTRLRASLDAALAVKRKGGALRLEEFRGFLDVILQDKLGFETASQVGGTLLVLGFFLRNTVSTVVNL